MASGGMVRIQLICSFLCKIYLFKTYTSARLMKLDQVSVEYVGI